MKIEQGAGAAFICIAILANAPARAQTAQQWRCTGGTGIPWIEQIDGCTRAINSGKYSEANLAWAYANRGNANYGLGDPKRAIVDYNAAIRVNPKLANAYLGRGNAYWDRGDLDRALEDYNKAIALDPREALAYNGRGNVFKRRGDLDRALEDYNKAIALDPREALAYNGRGNAYRGRGDLDRALEDYNKAIALDPREALAYNGRGAVYQDRGDLDRALADFRKAISLDPNLAAAYFNRGVAFSAKGDKDRALEDYNKAIELDPNQASAYYNRGNVYGDKNDLDRALADYDKAIALDPKYGLAFFAGGRLSLYKGDLPKAMADLNQAMKLRPKDAYVALWLDIVNRRSKLASRLDDAIKQIDMTQWPAPAIRLYLGQLTPAAVYAAADNPDAKTKKNQTCEAHFYIGEWALLRGGRDEAARHFRTVLADCSRTFIEYEGAAAELKALGAPVAVPASPPAETAAIGHTDERLVRAIRLYEKGDWQGVSDALHPVEVQRLTDLGGDAGGERVSDPAIDDFEREGLFDFLARMRNPRTWINYPLLATEDRAKELLKMGMWDINSWPGQLYGMFAGTLSADMAVLSATTPQQVCEARYFVGQWQIIKAQYKAAAESLEKAIDGCASDSIYREAAQVELTHIKYARMLDEPIDDDK